MTVSQEDATEEYYREAPEGTKYMRYKARQRGGKLQMTVLLESWLDFEETASIMAVKLPEGARRMGQRTVRREVQRACEEGWTGGAAARNADPKIVEMYRQSLVDAGMWPSSELDHAQDRREELLQSSWARPSHAKPE